MLAFDDAQKRVLALAKMLGTERLAVPSAANRVLAKDALAPVDAPAFDASMMDGYAVRAADVGSGPLPVSFESRAGSMPPALPRGSACRIFTGAPLPEDADAVVMQEDAERQGASVSFRSPPSPGAFVRRRGEDLRSGDVALARGTRIRAREIALLGSLDFAEVDVSCTPRVTIVPTGDELRPPGSKSSPASIPESNAQALATMARSAAARVDVLAPVSDDPDRVRDALAEALRSCDVLVTVGGVSVGEHDVVRAALEACDVELDFWRVAMKPGKPLAVGRAGERVVLGLPGNPVSAMITFAMFGIPLLRTMQGDAHPAALPTRARLARTIERKASDRLELARGRFDESGAVTLVHHQTSAAIVGLCQADALACIPAFATRIDAGAEIDVYSLTELGL